uniref:Uncharacterized protein n=1 Tax=Plectus sambesii TaxID=2011161 RepID=A0A914VW41_9BILA
MVPRGVVAYPVATGLNVARALSSSAKHNGSVAARFFSLSVHSLSVESAATSQRCRPRMGLHEAEPNDQDDQKDGQHFGAKAYAGDLHLQSKDYLHDPDYTTGNFGFITRVKGPAKGL